MCNVKKTHTHFEYNSVLIELEKKLQNVNIYNYLVKTSIYPIRFWHFIQTEQVDYYDLNAINQFKMMQKI